ncbi:hypothetical protein FZ103_16175 [Streptomonospora sp. PA3]|uniref:hypothetical protein n=1 Tax=Streptomonospora sp. PA3 TaxID=2607326 RepID=UPI0012DCECA2|nr:hypothetical protein [Streptomonospora sp. PA3]MUL42686.1 hypothetical protein [Streptomonospora sp. PA3]
MRVPWRSAVLELKAVIGESRMVDRGAVSWDAMERHYGFSFPPDYRDIVDSYGGLALNSLNVISPKWPGGRVEELASQTAEIEFIYSDLRSEFPEQYREMVEKFPFFAERGSAYPFHPERPGLLCWGEDGGASMYWLTDGDPEEWPVVVDYRDEIWEVHDMCAAQFLLEALTGELDSGIIHGELVTQTPIVVHEFEDRQKGNA